MPSLVGELRSHRLPGVAKKKRKEQLRTEACRGHAAAVCPILTDMFQLISPSEELVCKAVNKLLLLY